MSIASAELGHADVTGRSRRSPTDPGRRPSRRLLLLLTGAVAVSAAAAIGRGPVLVPGGGTAFAEFFAAAAAPRSDGEFLASTAVAAVTTLAYAVLGTALSVVIGVIGGVLTTQTWWMSGARRPGRRGLAAWAAARAVLAVPRGIHEVVWGLFFLILFGLDPIVAVLAIGIPFGAVTAKVFSELLDETPHGPYQALLAAGASRSSAFLYGLLPPALPDLLSYGFYRFECAIRSAAILGLIGAGGLGYELALSFQALRYHEIWTLLYALILISLAADLWSSTVRRRQMRHRRRDPALIGSLVLAALLVVASTWWVGLDPATLWSGQAWQRAARVFAAAWPPELDGTGFGGLMKLSAATMAVSILAVFVAFCCGAALAFPAARLPRMGRPRPGAFATIGRSCSTTASRLVLVVLRAIPPPVWALLLLFLFYPGILPGALALGVYTAGVLGRLMAEAVENLDGRPLRALRAQGASEAQVFCYGVIPAATPRFVAYGLYRWEVAIRETVVVGVVGAGGLGLLLDHRLHAFDYAGAAAALLALIALTLIVDLTSAAVRRTLR